MFTHFKRFQYFIHESPSLGYLATHSKPNACEHSKNLIWYHEIRQRYLVFIPHAWLSAFKTLGISWMIRVTGAFCPLRRCRWARPHRAWGWGQVRRRANSWLEAWHCQPHSEPWREERGSEAWINHQRPLISLAVPTNKTSMKNTKRRGSDCFWVGKHPCAIGWVAHPDCPCPGTETPTLRPPPGLPLRPSPSGCSFMPSTVNPRA